MKSALALLALGVVMSSCKLFESEGTACLTDSNCPNAQVCCNGACTKSCVVTGSISASTTLATDYVPGYEFDTVTIVVDGSLERQVRVNAVTDLASPRTISQFAGLQPGAHSMRLTLSLTGTTVAARTISFDSQTDIEVPFIITRDCAGLRCTGDADQCVGGRCVRRACSDLNPSACPSPACAADGDCIAMSDCTVGVCISGICLQRRRDASCKADQRCIPGTGCVAQHDECDVDLQCDDLASCTQERCVDHRCTSARDDTRCGASVCDPTAKTADPNSGCMPKPCSPDTCAPGPCEIATCVDGQCQRSKACQAQEQCCDGVCALDCTNPRPCASRAVGDVCRVAVGACDVPETCNGTSDACPPNVVQPNTFACRPATGPCDVSESCDGTSARCPADTLLTQGTVCRAIADRCDTAESCTGQSGACPVDVFAPVATSCRPAQGPCDVAELCSGNDPTCPTDAFAPTTTVCRPSAGVCDIEDSCTGVSADCPADARAASGTVCNPSQGPCDPAETCNGGTVCPANVFYDSSHVCRASQNATCDPAEVCAGGTAACPTDRHAAAGTACGTVNICAALSCDGSGGCTQQSAQNNGTPCDSATCAYCANGSCINPSCVCLSRGKGQSGCL